MELAILHEDNHLLVVNKPPGIGVQGDASGDACLLDLAKTWLVERRGRPGRVFLAAAHRLDRPVSGVLVLARTGKAAGRLSAAFREGRVHKEYLAVVHGAPREPEGEVRSYLRKDPARNRVTFTPEPLPGAREAVTRYRLLVPGEGRSLVSLEPVTGRSHQLRVHLASLGCPVVGDLRYGPGPALGPGILLHCRRLEIPHPVGGLPQVFEAAVPAWWTACAGLTLPGPR